MSHEDQYLRRLIISPEMLGSLERRAARVNDGMRRLWWVILDSLQIGAFSAYALLPIEPNGGSWGYLAGSLPVALTAALLASQLRRSGSANYFAKETTYAQMLRGAQGAFITFVAVGAFGGALWSQLGIESVRVVVCAACSIGISILLTLWLTQWSAQSGVGTASVAVIGEAETATNVTSALQANRWPGWSAALQLDDTSPAEVERLRLAVADGEIDVVIIAVNRPVERVRRIVTALPDATARVCVALDVPQPSKDGVAIWLVDLWRNPHDGIPGAIKRMIDLLASAFLLVTLSPLLLLVALAIKCESRGPVLFRQWRFGACSRPFEVLKFRTMRTDLGDAKGAQRTVSRDPRVTAFGRIIRRTSIDELPQLFNVLVGDMSLVGPRAQALYMEVDGDLIFEALGDYPARHRVLPGITGWAQVNGSRGEVDTIEKAKTRTDLDLWYIKNWSLWLDCRIILRTAMGGFMNFEAD